MAAFAVLVVWATLRWQLPLAVGWGYLIASAVCFAVYALDKSAAIAGRRRVAERTLLLLGFAGGWPGAVVAQGLLRHKSRKRPFLLVFWAGVALHVGAFVALAGPWRPALRGFPW